MKEITRQEGETDKQGLYQKKKQCQSVDNLYNNLHNLYVPGWAASEEFLEGVKHDLVYEL